MTVIQFDGIEFDDAASSGFTVSTLVGWWDGPGVKVEIRERPRADGAFGVAQSNRASRVVTIEGSFAGSTLEDAYAAVRRIAALQASGRPSLFRVVEPFTALSCEALLTGAPVLPNQLFSPFFTFKFDVVATDPLLYGDPVTVSTGVPVAGGGLVWPLGSSSAAYWDWGVDGTSGRVTLRNDGTAGAWPTVTATGGMSGGFVATAVQGAMVRSVRFERVIPDGSLVSINFRTGRAWIDAPGNDVSGFITVGDFFQVPAGSSLDVQFAPLGVVTGTPTFTATVSPAFL